MDWRPFSSYFQLPTTVSVSFCPCRWMRLTLFLSVRPLDLDVHLQSFSIPHFPSLMISMSKPAYLAILEYSPTKPVIIFVSSRKQCRLTADDIIAHCGSDEDSKRFLNIEEEDLQPHLDHTTDKGLVETLKYGIGYFHEALDKQDKRIVERLFKAGAIQVMIASRVGFYVFFKLIRTQIYNRKLLGACPSRVIWSSLWVFNTTKVGSTDTSTIPSWRFSR